MKKRSSVKRSFYLSPETESSLNKWVAIWCAASNQTGYGAASYIADEAISQFTATYTAEAYSDTHNNKTTARSGQ